MGIATCKLNLYCEGCCQHCADDEMAVALSCTIQKCELNAISEAQCHSI